MIVANWCMFRLLKYLPEFIIIPCAEINTQWFQCSVRPCNPNRCVTFGNKIALFNIFFIFIVCDSNHISVNCGSWHLTRMRRRKNWTIFHSSFLFWLSTIISKKGKRIRLLFGWSTHSREIFTCDRKHLVSLFPPNMKKKSSMLSFICYCIQTMERMTNRINVNSIFFSGWKETIWIGSWAVWMTTSIEIVSR